ncbi:hypothetical protein S40288_03763 [Stachybotrys chartarum IBT 40288]|nr:hypothetical protein S40288_03763 [Stachybotrys chartarum IBT 40288]
MASRRSDAPQGRPRYGGYNDDDNDNDIDLDDRSHVPPSPNSPTHYDIPLDEPAAHHQPHEWPLSSSSAPVHPARTSRARFGPYEPQSHPPRANPVQQNPFLTRDESAVPPRIHDAARLASSMAEMKQSPRSTGFSSGSAPSKARDGRIAKTTRKDHAKERVGSWYQTIVIEGILRQKPLPPTADGRHVPLNPTNVGPHGLIDERSQKPYISNFIRSSRYNLWDFIPKQLVFQFSKLGNFYFLVVGTLQMVPGLSTVGSWTTIAPLGFFVAFSMAKEGYDDYRRYVLDKVENRSTAWVLAHGVRDGQYNPSEKANRREQRKQLRQQQKRDRKGGNGDDPDMVDHHNANRSAAYGSDADWMPVQWQHVQVGDVLRLRRNDNVPADIVLLNATGPNGIAYIETIALDGETNLKSKQACTLLAERCSTFDGLASVRGTIVSEDPNMDLYSFDGRATIDGETLPLTLNNVVYRGSTLRNTSEAYGLVINTGEECKIRMNANKNVRTKKPAIQSTINQMVGYQIIVATVLACGLTGGYYIWEPETGLRSWYLIQRGMYNASVPFVEIFFGFIIMFNTLIPLSLYISMEIIKIGQLFLLWDADMYDPVSDTPMVANTMTILENLGQVSYVFTDKTGTLTENLMRFRKLSVAGVAALHDVDMDRDEEAKLEQIRSREKTNPLHTPADAHDKGRAMNQRIVPTRNPSSASMSRWRSSVRPDDVVPGMKTEDMLLYAQRNPHTAFSKKVKQFILCIALCHTALPETHDNGDITFQASSPDELALVDAARDMGYLVIDRPAQTIVLQISDPDGTTWKERYQVLDVIEFSSKRKRMSIIIRMPDGRLCVFCKGADNVIMERLRLNQLAEQKAKEVNRRVSVQRTTERDMIARNSMNLNQAESDDLRLSFGNRNSYNEVVQILQRGGNGESGSRRLPSYETSDVRVDESVAESDAAIFENCFQHIESFAADGLRTLLYAYRYIDDGEYSRWKQIYREAETSLANRQERIEEASEQIEQRFELAGATAIEDKLQDGVPETIDKLRRANIKVWMLTGDKRETAVNIGHSARVVKPYSEVFTLDVDEGNLHDMLKDTLKKVTGGNLPHTVAVIDGKTLGVIDADEALAAEFYDLTVVVDSVICCRASPLQKANLVRSVRRYVPKSMTLAIGDGANDIGMIQESHVGIGISGREGLQAARISDYSIAQFRFLQKLLFVHGRWNYLRTCKYVLATFWKEMVFFLVQAHFQGYNGYTGTSLYEEWSLTVFNVFFTSLPVIMLGIFEKDLEAETLLAAPELYSYGQDGHGFNYLHYIWWMVMGTGCSFAGFYTMWAVYDNALFTSDTSLYAIGVVCFTVSVVYINIKLLILDLHTKTIITFGGFAVSVVGWFVWLLILSGAYERSVGPYIVRDGFIENFGRQLLWWATVLLGLTILVVAELVLQAVRRVYWPNDQDLMQRIEKDALAQGKLRDQAQAAERGETDGIELRELIAESERDRAIRKQEKKKNRRGFKGRKAKASGNAYEDYRPPNFTPPEEIRENPFETQGVPPSRGR